MLSTLAIRTALASLLLLLPAVTTATPKINTGADANAPTGPQRFTCPQQCSTAHNAHNICDAGTSTCTAFGSRHFCECKTGYKAAEAWRWVPYLPGPQYQRVFVEPGVKCNVDCSGKGVRAWNGCGRWWDGGPVQGRELRYWGRDVWGGCERDV